MNVLPLTLWVMTMNGEFNESMMQNQQDASEEVAKLKEENLLLQTNLETQSQELEEVYGVKN